MGILPANNVINVTITNTPSGLAERNVNNIGLFTTESPSGAAALASYQEYISAAQVASDYGTDSVTAKMANAIFSQTPNIRTGDGQLTIIPLDGSVSAAGGDVTTADISANLASLIAVTDGDLRVTVDGVNYDLTGVNLTGATDMAGIATILDGLLVNAIVSAPDANTLKFVSKKVGADADVTLAQLPSGSGTDLAGSGYLNAAGATVVSGADASGETIAESIARVGGSASVVAIITNLEMEDDVLEALSDTVQAQDRILLHHVCSTVDIAGGIGETIQQSGNTKTRLLGYTESPEEANLFKAAYAGRAFSVNFNGTDTSQTMNLKQLTTITPDLGVTQTLYNDALDNGVDLYVSYDGIPSVYSTGGNNFFDNVYSDLALKFALETDGFNYLRQTNTQVPQTEVGMEGLKDAYAKVMQRFVRVGAIAAGAWTSSETFGDPETFKENILAAGYYVYSIPIVQQTAPEREAREAPLCQIAAKRAGAIHTSDVLVVVND